MSQGSEFDRLEQFVGKLLSQYDQLLHKNTQLKRLLQQKEDEIQELKDRVNTADSERGDISSRIKGLIDQIEEWQTIVLESEEEEVEKVVEESAVYGRNSAPDNTRDEDREAHLQRNLFHVEQRGNGESGD